MTRAERLRWLAVQADLITSEAKRLRDDHPELDSGINHGILPAAQALENQIAAVCEWSDTLPPESRENAL